MSLKHAEKMCAVFVAMFVILSFVSRMDSTTSGSGYLWASSTTILRPNGVGALSQLSANGDTPGWKCVDESSADGAATYVGKVGSGYNYDLYALSSFGETGTIINITLYIRCDYEWGSSPQGWAIPYLGIGNANYGGGEKTLTDAWTTYSKTWTTNPSTGLAWTVEDLEGLQAGVGLYAMGGTVARCTQVYIIVEYTPANEATIILRPDGPGEISGLNKYGLSTNWKCVREGEEGDTIAYVEKIGSGYVYDVYSFADLPSFNGSISRVTLKFRADYEDGTSGWAIPRLRIGGSNYNGNEITLQDDWTLFSQSWNANPNTGGAWTSSAVNALQAGVGLYGQLGDPRARCTQVYLEVVIMTSTPLIHVNFPAPVNTQPAQNGFAFQGKRMAVEWIAHLTGDNCRIELWNADTQTYESTIVQSVLSNTGKYAWTMPATISGNKFIKIVDIDNTVVYGLSGKFEAIPPRIDTYVFALDLIGAYESNNTQYIKKYELFFKSCAEAGAKGIRLAICYAWQGHAPISPFVWDSNIQKYRLSQWNSTFWSHFHNILQSMKASGLEPWISMTEYCSIKGQESEPYYPFCNAAESSAGWDSEEMKPYHSALFQKIYDTLNAAGFSNNQQYMIEPMNECGGNQSWLQWAIGKTRDIFGSNSIIAASWAGTYNDSVLFPLVDYCCKHGIIFGQTIINSTVPSNFRYKVMFSGDGGFDKVPSPDFGYQAHSHDKDLNGYAHYGMAEYWATTGLGGFIGITDAILQYGYKAYEYMDRTIYHRDYCRSNLKDFIAAPLIRLNLDPNRF